MKRRQYTPILIAIFAISYAALIFSSTGIQVMGKVATSKNAILDLVGVKTLHCTYFTGTGLVTKEFPYSENEMLGRAICPRTIKLGEEPHA